MDLNKINNVYFLGIGGIGMSALARYFKAFGKNVAGYDKTPTPLTDELIAEGINIHFEDNINLVPKSFKSTIKDQQSTILIILTPAVPANHSEYVFFKQSGFNMVKRSQALGLITEQSYTIAVAGTHGKTTTSSLMAHILKHSDVDCSAFLGGITKNYNTNLLLAKNNTSKTPVVVEADEYDRSFLTLHPEIATITSLDADHLDIYGDVKYMEESYNLFAQQVKPNGKLVLSEKIKNKISGVKANVLTYSINPPADYYMSDLVIEEGQYIYDVNYPKGKINKVTLGIPGLHNVENSLAATAMAHQAGISDEQIKKALGTFQGVRRRFDYQIKTKELVFIDDYAHHPAELSACINSVKQLYPDKKITGIFQPHLFTRTRDFADEFAKSLDLLDELILMEIYPARELPIEGVNSKMLLDKMKSKNKIICQKKDLVNEVSKRDLQVLLTLGAGDIDTFVEPIKNVLLKGKL